MRSSRRCAPPAATGSTPTTTRRACDRCKPHLAQGLSAAEAARLVREATAPEPQNGAPADLAAALWSALDRFDDAGAQAAFDRLVATFGIETVAETAILPYLRTLGERWRDGDASVAQEHFATGLLRARLLGLARGWDRGAGPRALLACPSGERHDLGLIILGLALRDRGWRVTFLGPDTPTETLAAAADQLAPDVVVLSSLARDPLAAAANRDRANGRLAARAACRPRRGRRAGRAFEGPAARRGPDRGRRRSVRLASAHAALLAALALDDEQAPRLTPSFRRSCAMREE